MKVNDLDVIKFLKMFTFLELKEIEEIEVEHFKLPEAKLAQKVLSIHITDQIYGKGEGKKKEKVSEILFGEALIEGLSSNEIEEIFKDYEFSNVDQTIAFTKPIAIISKEIKFTNSTSKFKFNPPDAGYKLINEGGFYVNNKRVETKDYILKKEDLIDNKIVVLRKGKKNYHIIKINF
jgi:tyrosyl-tRNA synthetase